jgi:hypothetical protein
LEPPNALLAVGAAVGAVAVVAGVVLALAVVGVVLAAAGFAVVGVVVVLGAAVVEVVLGAVVDVEFFFEDDEVVLVVFLAALGVPEPHAAATRPPASTMVPMSHGVRLRLRPASVVPWVIRLNPNTYCSSHRCGAPYRHAPGRELLRRVIPTGAT